MHDYSRLKPIALYFFSAILATVVLIQVICVTAVNTENKRGVKVPIIMYHSVVKDASRANEYVVSVDTFEKDLQYLRQNGYTTIVVSDLINYVYYDGTLPDKPVMITLDDGHLNNLTYVLPLLEKYDMKACISVVGYYTDLSENSSDRNPLYSYLNWDDILELYRSNRIEIGLHSYNLHSNTYKRVGSTKNKNETFGQYEEMFLRDTLNLISMLRQECDITSTFYTYPFGFYCDESERILKSIGIKVTLTCADKANYITRSPDCLYHLNRYNRPSGISTQSYMKNVLK